MAIVRHVFSPSYMQSTETNNVVIGQRQYWSAHDWLHKNHNTKFTNAYDNTAQGSSTPL